MLDNIVSRFKKVAPAVDFWSLRLSDRKYESLSIRQGVLQPPAHKHSLGAFITIVHGQGHGYAATCDVSREGLSHAAHQAVAWAKQRTGLHLLRAAHHPRLERSANYHSEIRIPWSSWPLGDKFTLLHDADKRLNIADTIVDRSASLNYETEKTLLTCCEGKRIEQSFGWFTPGLVALANRDSDTQRRSFGFDQTRQGGLETFQPLRLLNEATRISEEAVALLHAPNCPSGRRSLLLTPAQMILQIHESIGHPLELDRILGDERNYAGTSFVTKDMFGQYRYGSALLNVTYDPRHKTQAASFAFDDEGQVATREYIIRKGILQRPLGSRTSQLRSALSGVSNARASDWNRPPIDRMANLNLEPGDSSLEQMIASVEKGILMDTNLSWSIDDSRIKFQFGCELGRLIENGELKALVKNPNYRGLSPTFWRSLVKTGDTHTYELMSVPHCGKGEPNQMIRVGHASPACLFAEVEVFGGV